MIKRLPIELPEMEVKTPQSGQTYRIQSLVFANEHSFRSSIYNSPKAILDKLNHLIYNTIKSEKPSYDEFINNISTIDRDAIIYGLYEITYGDEYNINDYKCPQCERPHDISISMSSGFNVKFYEGKTPLLKLEHEVKLNDKLSAIIIQPTCKMELDNIEKYSGANSDLIWRLCIKEFRYKDDQDKDQVITQNDKFDFIEACDQLPSQMVNKIMDEFDKTFAQYQVECKIQDTCPYCNNTEELNFDFTKQFFRMVSKSRK